MLNRKTPAILISKLNIFDLINNIKNVAPTITDKATNSIPPKTVKSVLV